MGLVRARAHRGLTGVRRGPFGLHHRFPRGTSSVPLWRTRRSPTSFLQGRSPVEKGDHGAFGAMDLEVGSRRGGEGVGLPLSLGRELEFPRCSRRLLKNRRDRRWERIQGGSPQASRTSYVQASQRRRRRPAAPTERLMTQQRAAPGVLPPRDLRALRRRTRRASGGGGPPRPTWPRELSPQQ